MAEIDDLRTRIDAIDRQLVALLCERATCALAIGKLKELAGLPIYQPTREAEVLSNVRAANAGPLDNEAMVRLFERVIDEARRLERVASGLGSDEGQTGVRRGSDQGQTRVRPGSDQGQTPRQRKEDG